MTTKLIIESAPESNGDVVVQGMNTTEGHVKFELLPGEKRELWITSSTMLIVTETWPTKAKKDEEKPSG